MLWKKTEQKKGRQMPKSEKKACRQIFFLSYIVIWMLEFSIFQSRLRKIHRKNECVAPTNKRAILNSQTKKFP